MRRCRIEQNTIRPAPVGNIPSLSNEAASRERLCRRTFLVHASGLVFIVCYLFFPVQALLTLRTPALARTKGTVADGVVCKVVGDDVRSRRHSLELYAAKLQVCWVLMHYVVSCGVPPKKVRRKASTRERTRGRCGEIKCQVISRTKYVVSPSCCLLLLSPLFLSFSLLSFYQLPARPML